MSLPFIHFLKLGVTSHARNIANVIDAVVGKDIGRGLRGTAIRRGTIAEQKLVNRQPILQLAHSLLQITYSRFEVFHRIFPLK